MSNFERLGSVAVVLLAGACRPEPEPAPVVTFEPTSMAIGFDGVVTPNGTLEGYRIGDEVFQPALILQFVSDEWFDATDPVTIERESCVAIATFDPTPLPEAGPIETVGDVPLFFSYQEELVLEASSCPGRADPKVWGPEGEVLIEAFDGSVVGLGIGPLTDRLRETWPEDTLTDYGKSMLTLWLATDDDDGTRIARDRTTVLAYQWDAATGQVVSVTDAAGNVSLLEVDVSELVPGDPWPGLYVQSFPEEFQPLSELALGLE